MGLYNDDELVAPAWINQDFLEKVLVQYENNEFIEVTLLFITNFMILIKYFYLKGH